MSKSGTLAINNTETSKRDTLADRAGRSGIVPPRSTVTGGITKPGSRSTSTAPGTVNRHASLPRPKSSMERVRPPSFSGTNGIYRSTQSKPSSVSGGSRPPSAQEMRSASALDDDSDSNSIMNVKAVEGIYLQH